MNSMQQKEMARYGLRVETKKRRGLWTQKEKNGLLRRKRRRMWRRRRR